LPVDDGLLPSANLLVGRLLRLRRGIELEPSLRRSRTRRREPFRQPPVLDEIPLERPPLRLELGASHRRRVGVAAGRLRLRPYAHLGLADGPFAALELRLARGEALLGAPERLLATAQLGLALRGGGARGRETLRQRSLACGQVGEPPLDLRTTCLDLLGQAMLLLGRGRHRLHLRGELIALLAQGGALAPRALDGLPGPRLDLLGVARGAVGVGLRLLGRLRSGPEAHGGYIRKTPNVVSGMGALRAAERPRASTRLVSSGSMMPSSHRRAVEKYGLPSSSYFARTSSGSA